MSSLSREEFLRAGYTVQRDDDDDDDDDNSDATTKSDFTTASQEEEQTQGPGPYGSFPVVADWGPEQEIPARIFESQPQLIRASEQFVEGPPWRRALARLAHLRWLWAPRGGPEASGHFGADSSARFGQNNPIAMAATKMAQINNK